MAEKRFAEIFDLFFNPGEITEIRVLGVHGKGPWDGFARETVHGYFDNAADFARAAQAIHAIPTIQAPAGIYFLPNPADPRVINRAANRMVASGPNRPATGNGNIAIVRWLLIDLDPERPTGISSSKTELERAASLGKKVMAFMGQLGFAQPIKGMSGNGYHLIYRIADRPADNSASIQNSSLARALAALAAMFPADSSGVKIDQSVHNPARIWKLYGTVARKGDNTKERPHRKSRLLFADDKSQFKLLADVPICPESALEALAAMAPAPIEHIKPVHSRMGASSNYDNHRGSSSRSRSIRVSEYLDHYGIEYKLQRKYGDSLWHILPHCLFDDSHAGKDAAIVQETNGTIWYHCSHDSCKSRRWADARIKISGRASLLSFCEGFDPNERVCFSSDDRFVYSIEIIYNSFGVDMILPGPLPSPTDIDPSEFFENRGRREVFCVLYLVKYLVAVLNPIVCTAGTFYHYIDGLWSKLEKGNIENIIIRALKNRFQTSFRDQAISALQSMVAVSEKNWPNYENLINCMNGMVDLSDFSLKPHDPKYCSRTQIPCNYDIQASYEVLDKFLAECFPETDKNGNRLLGKYLLLQEFAGYCLLPSCRFEKMLLCFGTGANGKSTFISALIDMLGKDNVTSFSIGALGHRFNVPYLQHKALNSATELDEREDTGTDILKACISGDLVSGEFKHGDIVKFCPKIKFIFAINKPPPIRDKSHGYKRKVLVINWERRFEEHEQDRTLKDKLREQKDGFFLWALLGLQRLLEQNGFTITPDVKEGIDQYHERSDPMLLWANECLDFSAGLSASTVSVYNSYKVWCEESNVKSVLGRNNFQSHLMDTLRVRKSRLSLPGGSHGQNVYEGIALKDNL